MPYVDPVSALKRELAQQLVAVLAAGRSASRAV
jgi:hypothetical protein